MAIPNIGANQIAEESSLSSWAGPYVTEMLGRGQALAGLPYQAYMGPLTAGESGLQQQAFQGLGALQTPTAQQTTYDPTSFTAAGMQEQYMSPFLQGALDPQYAAAQRQADISAQNLQSQFGKAGAYGGSRQGVAEAELQRGLLDRMAGITGTGYQQAFEQAQRQFNEEQRRQMDAANQAQRYGLDVLREQQAGGATQRGIESQGIAADIAQFEQERDYPFKNVQFMQSLLQGQPLETQSYSYSQPTGLESLAGGVGGVKSILDLLSRPNNSGTGPDGGYSQATQSAALQGQYDYYVAMGQTPAQAMASAKADLGIG
jgi:hypothetical protein